MATGGEAAVRYCPSCEREFEALELCPDDHTRLVRLVIRGSPPLGKVLDGRYSVGELLGRGAMGNVYRGIQHAVGRPVAIKVISSELVGDPIVVKRFLREAKLACMLAHPNAVSVLDFGQTPEGLFYIVMELVAGQTLEEVLAREHVLAPERIVRIATQVCDALEGAHQLQIVHRDLKPANVMLLSTGRELVKVLDFGLAKSLAPRVGSAMMTTAGALVGTPAYLAPELVTGGEWDARVDLYALGCIAYLAVSGQPPFTATTIHELIMMHATEEPAPLSGIPRELARTIEQLLAKDPLARFQSAGEARAAFESSLQGEAAVEVAQPTLLSTNTSTMLGWTSASSSSAQRLSAAHIAASAAARPPATVQADDRELHTSAPALFMPGGIAPTARPPARRELRWLVFALVAALACAAAVFAIAR